MPSLASVTTAVTRPSAPKRGEKTAPSSSSFLSAEALGNARAAVGASGLAPDGSALKFYTSPFVLEFAAGIALGCAFMDARRRVPAPLAALALLAGFAVLATLDLVLTPNRLPSQLLVGLAATLIVGGAVFLEKDRLCPRLALPRLLGDASYSIYLSHFIVLSAFGQLWRHLHLAGLPGEGAIFIVAATVVSAAGGCALYLVVERPLTRALKGLRTGAAPLRGVPPRALDAGALTPSTPAAE